MKKTSHSRRLIKQLKAEKKREKVLDSQNTDDASKDSELDADKATTAASNSQATDAISAAASRANELDPELDITFKDNIQRSDNVQRKEHWTLTGREAEALHMEEEDNEAGGSNSNSPKSDTSDPLQKLLQSG